MRANDTAELFFSDVHVPVANLLGANLLGEEGPGFRQLMSKLPQERLGIAVTAVAHVEVAFGWARDYAKERQAFGQPIGSFQHNRFTLAEMRTVDIAHVYVDCQVELHNAGELTAETPPKPSSGPPNSNGGFSTPASLHGGYGYREEYPIARAWRDGRVMSIYGGTNEIMKEIIVGRSLGL